ncbi:indoleacetaldoxime dehydratase-like [Phalaenopsis equestris]|uniref:indoleacetaldoxime dehydratase-like n=1 Tax=Phalaenopsis equestris TaxID=78828 RepID=UPI0009E1EEA9|nr:indoleacetaldoxime dehydratase-like [Phalaenopsis equestris]
MEWAMAELLRHPTAMEKLKDEITNIVGTNESFIKEEQLAEMSYLKAVVKEVLRLHPSLPIIIPSQVREGAIIKGKEILCWNLVICEFDELAMANLVHVFDWKPTKRKAEDINMGEDYGLTTRKKEALLLIGTKAIK